MAEVSRKVGAGVCRLSVFKTPPNICSRGNYGRRNPHVFSVGLLHGSRNCENKGSVCQEPCKCHVAQVEGQESSTGCETYEDHLDQMDLFEWTSEKENIWGTAAILLGSCIAYQDMQVVDTNVRLAFIRPDDPLLLDVKQSHYPVHHLQSQCRISRMSCWRNRDIFIVSFPTVEYRAGWQHRAYCTILMFTDRRARTKPPSLRSFTDNNVVLSRRAYSWGKGDNKSASPLHRSKTAYYDILQVSRTATQSQIKTAYYKQSFIHHPDKNAGSEEAARNFAQISEAYRILGSKGLRRKYDRGLLSMLDVQGAGRPTARDAPMARPKGPFRQKQQSQRFSNTTTGGKPMFDFDAFYQGHYGQQLQKEQELRVKREQQKQKEKEQYEKLNVGMLEITIGVVFALAGALILSFKF